MLHEMCHLYAMQKGIKDTSRNGYYHNEKFRDIAAAHHLTTTHNDRVGWNASHLDEYALAWLEKHCPFLSIRIGKETPPPKAEREKKPSSTRKYQCPCCGLSVRATKEVHVKCMECDEELQPCA